MYNIYHSSLSDETCTTERGLDLVIRVFYALKFSSKYDRYVHMCRLRSMMIYSNTGARMERALRATY